ncbi:hypothetical protein [Niallia oryzisoli]|uniref:hypothetical protein n=1 Tax=Niallia oryzisoli TaxID=1737571 RepID=UPI003734E9AB
MKKKNNPFYESIDDQNNEPIDDPFNDVIDHFNKIEGNAGKPSNADLGKLPKPFKYFGYFVIGFFVVAILLSVILNIIN